MHSSAQHAHHFEHFGTTEEGEPLRSVVGGGSPDRLLALLEELPDYLMGQEVISLPGPEQPVCANLLHAAIAAGRLDQAEVLIRFAVGRLREPKLEDRYVLSEFPQAPALLNGTDGQEPPLDFAMRVAPMLGLGALFYEHRECLARTYDWIEVAIRLSDAGFCRMLLESGEPLTREHLVAAVRSSRFELAALAADWMELRDLRFAVRLDQVAGAAPARAILRLHSISDRLGPDTDWLRLALASENPDLLMQLLDQGLRAEQAIEKAVEHGLPANLSSLVARADLRDERLVEMFEEFAERGFDEAAASLSHAISPEDAHLLHVAVSHGRSDLVRRLLESGWPVDAPDAQGHTALHVAAAGQSVEVVDLLLGAGARSDVPARAGALPLHVACETANWEVVQRLADKRFTFVRDDEGWTPLAQSVAHGCVGTLLKVPAARYGKSIERYMGWAAALSHEVIQRGLSCEGRRLYLTVSPERLLETGRLAFPDLEDANQAKEQFAACVSDWYGTEDPLSLMKTQSLFGPIGLVALSVLAAYEAESSVGHELHGTLRRRLGRSAGRYHNEHLGSCWKEFREWVRTNTGAELAWSEDTSLVNVGAPIRHSLWRHSELVRLHDLLLEHDMLPDLDNTVRLRMMIRNLRGRLPTRAEHRLAEGRDEIEMVEAAAEWLREYNPPASSEGAPARRTVRGALAMALRHGEGSVGWGWRIPYREGDPPEIQLGASRVERHGDIYELKLDHRPDELGACHVPEESTFRVRLESPTNEPISFVRTHDCYVSGMLEVGVWGAVLTPASQAEEVHALLSPCVHDGLEASSYDGVPDGYILYGPFRLCSALPRSPLVQAKEHWRVEIVEGLAVDRGRYLSGCPVVLLVRGVANADFTWTQGQTSLIAQFEEREDGYRVPAPCASPGAWTLASKDARLAEIAFVEAAYRPRGDSSMQRRHLVISEPGFVVGARVGDYLELKQGRRKLLAECPFRPMFQIGDQLIPCRRDLLAPIREPRGPHPEAWSKAIRQTTQQPVRAYVSGSQAKRVWKAYKEVAGG